MDEFNESNDEQDLSALRCLGLGAAARGFAHDVVNPINVMLMNAEMALMYLASDGDVGDEVAEALRIIVKEAKRAGA